MNGRNALVSVARLDAAPDGWGEGRWRQLLALFALALLTGCALARHWEAALVLTDVAAGEAPSRLKAQTAAPQR